MDWPGARSTKSICALKSKSSVALSRSMAYHAEAQHTIAEMVLELESIGPHLEAIAADWSNGVDHGAQWPSKLFAAKYKAVEGTWTVVDMALEVSGGFAIFRRAGMERMFRDARLGRIHPASSCLTHEVAKTALGIGLDEQPRWGRIRERIPQWHTPSVCSAGGLAAGPYALAPPTIAFRSQTTSTSLTLAGLPE